MNESLKVVCTKCNSTNTFKRISGGAGIHFKGSGFYVTDYKKKNNVPEESKSTDNRPDSSGDSKTDKKKAKVKTETRPTSKD